ncbi:MAG: radical SAM protein [bacterium]
MFSKVYEETNKKVLDALEKAKNWDVSIALSKIKSSEELNLLDYASLLADHNKKYRDCILESSEKITRKNFKSKVGFIVPIYIDTRCQNKCKYCGMSSEIKNLDRKWLDYNSFLDELNIVVEMKYNTVELVAGSLNYDFGLLKKMMSAIRDKVDGSAFCFESLTEDEYKIFANYLDTTILFQETYDEKMYKYYHPKDTKKGDMDFRLDASERAMSAGIKKIGIGVLFGLSKMEYDVLMLIEYGNYLKERYDIFPHLIGIPRLKSADGTEIRDTGFEVSDDDYIFATAIYRLAFPNAEIVASTRENPECISKLLKYSATFTNFCCSLKPGGYKELKDGLNTEGQFHYYSPGYNSMKNLIEKNGLEMDFKRYI